MSQFISLDLAKKMADLYRANRNTILEESERDKNILAVSETFDADMVRSVLAQSDCTGLRIYYGMSEDKKVHAILVGVDKSGTDILPKSSTEAEASNIIEESVRCPDICPPPSPLYP